MKCYEHIKNEKKNDSSYMSYRICNGKRDKKSKY